jgi:hypothetical protein
VAGSNPSIDGLRIGGSRPMWAGFSFRLVLAHGLRSGALVLSTLAPHSFMRGFVLVPALPDYTRAMAATSWLFGYVSKTMPRDRGKVKSRL